MDNTGHETNVGAHCYVARNQCAARYRKRLSTYSPCATVRVSCRVSGVRGALSTPLARAWQSFPRALPGTPLQRVPARAFHVHCTEFCRFFFALLSSASRLCLLSLPLLCIRLCFRLVSAVRLSHPTPTLRVCTTSTLSIISFWMSSNSLKDCCKQQRSLLKIPTQSQTETTQQK